MSFLCTACLKDFDSELLFEADRIPVINNRVYNSYQDAISCKTGIVNLVQCPHCGMIFNHAYNFALVDYNDSYDNCRSNSPKYDEHLDAVVTYCSGFLTPQSRVVEIGCGNGDFLKKLSDVTSCQAEGYDLAYQGQERYGSNVKFYSKYCDCTEPCDMVIIRHVLEHVALPGKFVKDLFALGLIKEGTHLIIEVPNFQWVIDSGTFYDVTYEHCNYFLPDALVNLLRSLGFTAINVNNTLFNSQYLLGHFRFGSSAEAFIIQELSPKLKTPLSAFELARTRLTRQITSVANSVVWGASGKGVVFLSQIPLDVCNKIKFVVDINPAKQNNFVPVSGHKIIAPKDLQNEVVPFLIIVMNSIYLNEIANTIKLLKINAQVISAEYNVVN